MSEPEHERPGADAPDAPERGAPAPVDRDDPRAHDVESSGGPERRRGVMDPVFSAEDGLLAGLRATDEHAPAWAGGVDPWAHRRGEPRLFALLWSVYLFGAALTTVMRIPIMGMSEARFVQDKARMLLLLIAVGLALLWPMVRLSQVRPRRPVTAALVDLFALLLPAQAVVWPLKWLGGWNWEVAAGVNAMLASWALLVGAHVAIGTSAPAGLARSVWMALVVVLVCAAPIGAGLAGLTGVDAPDELALASPLTGLYAITTAQSGLSPRMSSAAWLAASIPALAALPFWMLAPSVVRMRQPGHRAAASTSA